jgi:hypothetical protein
MSADILFDNLVITDSEANADEWAQQTFDLKRKHLENQAVSFCRHVAPDYGFRIFEFFIINQTTPREHFGSEQCQT